MRKAIKFLRNCLLVFCTLVAFTSASAQQVQVFWNDSIGTITPNHWGINDFQVMYTGTIPDPTYSTIMYNLSPNIIRIYHPRLVEDWTDSATRTWNITKIRRGFDGVRDSYNAKEIILNIPLWPSWLAPTNAPLPDSSKAEFVHLCAEFARIMRREIFFQVTYYEILNEAENLYSGRISEEYMLVDSIITNMRRTDGTAKYGGTAFNYANRLWIDTLLNTCGSHLDFVSYHNYPSGIGSTYLSNNDLLNDNGNSSYQIMAHAKQRYPLMKVFCDEFNVSSSRASHDPRMKNSVGAIWMAMNVKNAAINNIDGLLAYTLKDSIYGLFGTDFVRSPQAAMYYEWSKNLSGKLCRSTSTDSTKLELIPIHRQGSEGSLLILNKQDTSIDFSNWMDFMPQPTNMYSWNQISGTNPEASWTDPSRERLPPYSATLITFGFEFSVKDHNRNSSIIVYPNPSSTSFHIFSENGAIKNLSLLNSLGQIITRWSNSLDDGMYNLPNGLASGIYHLHFEENGQIVKLVIK